MASSRSHVCILELTWDLEVRGKQIWTNKNVCKYTPSDDDNWKQKDSEQHCFRQQQIDRTAKRFFSWVGARIRSLRRRPVIYRHDYFANVTERLWLK